MAMENLSIAQQRDILRHAQIHNGVYQPQLQRFQQGDYVYLQREAPTTLNVRAGRTIFWMKEVKGIIHPELAVVPEGLPCFVCGEKKRAAITLLCNKCQRGWHMACLRPPLTSLPVGQWSCPRC